MHLHPLRKQIGGRLVVYKGSDLAVIKIDARDPPTVKLGNPRLRPVAVVDIWAQSR